MWRYSSTFTSRTFKTIFKATASYKVAWNGYRSASHVRHPKHSSHTWQRAMFRKIVSIRSNLCASILYCVHAYHWRSFKSLYDADNNIKVFCLSRVRKNVENSHIFTIKRRSLTNQMHTKPVRGSGSGNEIYKPL
jgi:hypothetical protein